MFSDYSTPECREIAAARIQAFAAPIVDGPPMGFRGGVVLGEEMSEQKLRHSRYWKPVDSFSNYSPGATFLKGTFTYFGPYYEHFGHTMSEFVHRIVPSLNFGCPQNFLLIGDRRGHQFRDPRLPRFLREVFYFLNIDEDKITILWDNAIVENLFICEQGSDFGGGPKQGYLSHLDNFTCRRLDDIVGDLWDIEKVYVSRSLIRHGGNFLGERYIESLLKDEGFFIMHPESMSLVDQMQMYRSAKILIFPEGSACHGVEFFGQHALQELHLIERRASHREIFRRALEGRAKKMSVLAGAVEIPTLVLDGNRKTPLGYLSNGYIFSHKILEYFRSLEIARLNEFNIDHFQSIVIEDFENYLAYHRKNNSHLISDREIQDLRDGLRQLCLVDRLSVLRNR